MEKEFLGELNIEVDDDPSYNMHLSYYLTSTGISEDYCDLKIYGVEIDKEAVYPDGDTQNEKKQILDLFFNKGECNKFIYKLMENEVTPIGLKYAIKDYIGEKINFLNVKSN